MQYYDDFDNSRNMTSLIAWVASDERGVSSLTFASDSRISWGEPLPQTHLDTCTKLFASQVRPEIVGFTGDVDAAQAVASAFCLDTLPFGEDDVAHDAYGRFESLKMGLEERRCLLNRPLQDTTVFYGARLGKGLAGSDFKLFILRWSNTNENWATTYVNIERQMKSGVVQIDGSGAIAVADWQHYWAGNDAKHHFSRHIFASFCDAIVSASDPRTGGAPQLVTIRRTKNGQYLGVIFNDSAFVKGLAVGSDADVSRIEFFNRNYERVAFSGHLLANAQPQPRPATAPPPPKAR